MISKDRLWEIQRRVNVPDPTSFQCGQIALIEQLIEECGEDWMPIADAPKDRYLLLYSENYTAKGKWDERRCNWFDTEDHFINPTHYMLLPEDPK